MSELRYYQIEAHDAAINWIKKSTSPALIEAEGGSGKSHIISAIADTFYKISGKHVLCTAPNVDLVEQNTNKYLATGNKASIFSASISKSLRYPVVFGTPITILNGINNFSDKFGLVVIDECHGITKSIIKIIEELREKNKLLRILGLSATPYRLGDGYIYALDENDKPLPESSCVEPYFTKKIYTIGGKELIAQGFLTPPVIGAIHGDHYDTTNFRINKMGKFYQEDIDRAYSGQDRKTSIIINDIVQQSKYRRGVMIFAATVQHAKECLSSLPKEISRMIGGDVNMGKNERRQLVGDFRAMKFKYLVSVGTMTEGVDFPHVDVIALLRPSESVRLLRQIILRGARLYENKKDFLVLDYCEAIERHCPDGDLFSPIIEARKPKGDSTSIKAICEECGTENEFTGRENPDGFGIDENGFFTDLDGNRIVTEYGAMPAHYGRRCMGMQRQKNGQYEQCSHRWTFKECPECKEPNDIAARYCTSCRAEIVNPNDKLIADFKARKKDPYHTQCDKVLSWSKNKYTKEMKALLKVDFTTEFRSFSVWYQIQSGNEYFIKQYNKFLESTNGGDVMPCSITYRKNIKTGFYEILAYNQEVDKLELTA